jgi:hypothetical protein
MVVVVRQNGQGALLTGDTFAVKDLLRNHGGIWKPDAKGWFFSREASVLKVLAQEQVLVQDERPMHNATAASMETSSLGSGITCTPAPGRMRIRSRTPPASVKQRKEQLPEVRLNEQTVQERSAALAASARQVVCTDPAQEALGRNLVQKLRVLTGEGAMAMDDKKKLLNVEEVLAAADSLEACALESSGLVREAARIAFLRGPNAVALRRVGQRAWRRWLGRRTEAAIEEEEALLRVG